MFMRGDWTLFRTISGLCQKAGLLAARLCLRLRPVAILRQAEAETRIAAVCDSLRPRLEAMNGELTHHVRDALDREPERMWRDPVADIATEPVSQLGGGADGSEA